MSKASEYAEHKRPTYRFCGHEYAFVNDCGDLEFKKYASNMSALRQDDALALAHWIIETFGEPHKIEPSPLTPEEIEAARKMSPL